MALGDWIRHLFTPKDDGPERKLTKTGVAGSVGLNALGAMALSDFDTPLADKAAFTALPIAVHYSAIAGAAQGETEQDPPTT